MLALRNRQSGTSVIDKSDHLPPLSLPVHNFLDDNITSSCHSVELLLERIHPGVGLQVLKFDVRTRHDHLETFRRPCVPDACAIYILSIVSARIRHEPLTTPFSRLPKGINPRRCLDNDYMKRNQ